MLIVIASTFLCRFLIVESKYSEEACKAFSKPSHSIHSAFYLHFIVLLALL